MRGRVITLAILLAACVGDHGPVPVEEWRTVRYGSREWQLLDVLERPSDVVIVALHWGGWGGGSRDMMHGLERVFPEFSVVAPSYRLGTAGNPSAPFVMKDVAGAVAYAQGLPGVRRVVLMGFSSGGHLALLYAYQHPEAVDLVVSVAGPTDLRPMRDRARCLLGGAGEFVEGFNPVDDVTEDAPATVLVYGRHDPIVQAAVTARLVERLDECGVPCTLVSVPGGHRAAFLWPGLAGVVREGLLTYRASRCTMALAN